jgi:hypothetical protein
MAEEEFDKLEEYKKTVDATAQNEGYTTSDLHVFSLEAKEATSPGPGWTGKSTHDNFFYIKEVNLGDSAAPGPDEFIPTEAMAIFDAICEADVKLVEVPIYKKIVTVSDFPPAAPEVDIVPLNDRENEIKINFYPGTVGREMVPIIINDSDKVVFGNIRKAQDRDLIKNPEELPSNINPQVLQQMLNAPSFASNWAVPPEFYVEPKLIFKSDDFVSHYELYRVEEPPENWKSFVDNRIKLLNSKEESSYIDKIEQNKKYYYTFRSIDIHNNLSNPSPIYQVEIVENSGVSYPIISIFHFPSEQEQQVFKSKPFKRFLKISAAPLQKAIDYDESWWTGGSYHASNLGDIELGKSSLGNEKIFNYLSEQGTEGGNKKFKFRLKSRHTGKIIDLNVKFKLRKKEANETIVSCGDPGYIEKNIS